MLFICLFSACKKDGNDPGGSLAIKDEAAAKAAFLQINNLWTATLRPLIAKTERRTGGNKWQVLYNKIFVFEPQYQLYGPGYYI